MMDNIIYRPFQTHTVAMNHTIIHFEIPANDLSLMKISTARCSDGR